MAGCPGEAPRLSTGVWEAAGPPTVAETLSHLPWTSSHSDRCRRAVKKDKPSVRTPVRTTVRRSVRRSVRASVRLTVRPLDRPTVRPSVRPTVRPCIRPPTPEHAYTGVLASVHACTGASVHACTRALVHACTGALVHACTRALVHACTRALVHACKKSHNSVPRAPFETLTSAICSIVQS